MNKTRTDICDGNEVRALRSAALKADGVSTRVLLAPWGRVESTNGAFVVDEESAELAVRAFEEHGTDLPIDFEHQTLGGAYASPNGQAPAAGWIKSIAAEPGVGIFADIEWTPAAGEMLLARQYRYLSPVAIIRKGDRKLVAIHSAALTNKPAIVGMTPIVNRSEPPNSFGADVDPQSVERSSSTEAQLIALREELSLSSDCDVEELLCAARRRIAELNEEAKLQRVEARIAEAMRAGKLVEAQRAWAEALVAREEGLFDEWQRTAPVIVQPGSIAPVARNGHVNNRAESAAARARAEYRSNKLLSSLTTEDAYAADAVRDAKAA
jgi:phage I-like protein